MTEDEAKAWLERRVSRETFQRLEVYHRLLLKWQKTINLVAPATLDAAWARHFVDSAQVYDAATNTPKTWLDLGSGGGFPGLVVAVMAADSLPEFKATFVESDIRKCGFLREAAREMGIAVNILSRRIKDIPVQKADVVSARALSGLRDLVAFAEPHLTPSTQLLFPKGAAWREEVESLPEHWQTICTAISSATHPEAVVLKFDISQLQGTS